MKAYHQCSVGSKIPSSVSHTTFEHQQKGNWRQLGCGPHNLLATIKRNLEKTWVRPLAFAWPCLPSTELRLLNGLEAKLHLRHAITCQSSDVWHSSRHMYTTTIQQLYNNPYNNYTTTAYLQCFADMKASTTKRNYLSLFLVRIGQNPQNTSCCIVVV